jgi:hypothetical protein
MLHQVINLFLGCRHRQITRPITPVHKPNSEPGVTYVVCLECGKQFHYDLMTMSIGKVMIPTASISSDNGHFQASS